MLVNCYRLNKRWLKHRLKWLRKNSNLSRRWLTTRPTTLVLLAGCLYTLLGLLKVQSHGNAPFLQSTRITLKSPFFIYRYKGIKMHSEQKNAVWPTHKGWWDGKFGWSEYAGFGNVDWRSTRYADYDELSFQVKDLQPFWYEYRCSKSVNIRP